MGYFQNDVYLSELIYYMYMGYSQHDGPLWLWIILEHLISRGIKLDPDLGNYSYTEAYIGLQNLLNSASGSSVWRALRIHAFLTLSLGILQFSKIWLTCTKVWV